jgi:hypothetical protein
MAVEAALGGTTFPDEFTVQPLGSPEIVVVITLLIAVSSVAVAEPTHGYIEGVTKLDVGSPWVLSKGSGAVLIAGGVIVGTAGAAIVAAGFPGVPLPLILPPFDLMDCQVPLVPEYVYWEPVE